MAKTPWEMAAVGNEFSDQSALFAWAAMACFAGPAAANDPLSYTVSGHAAKTYPTDPPLTGLKWLHAIKNQGHGDKVRGSRSRAEGVRAGVSDIFLPVARVHPVPYGGLAPFAGSHGVYAPVPGSGLAKLDIYSGYHGLYVELKKLSEATKKNGGASDIQLEFQADVRVSGYACEVAHGWEAARDVILTYLEVKK